jgi:acyl-homoserine-lactone acylase
MFDGAGTLSFAQVIEAAQATDVELASRVLDELITAARQSNSDTAKEAAEVLATWDRRAEADSRGTALFALWYQEWLNIMLLRLSSGSATIVVTPALVNGPLIYVTPWQPQNPLDTPSGLVSPTLAVRALETAVQELQALGKEIDAPWGEVARLRRGNINVAANGGDGDLGVSRAFEFVQRDDGTFEAVGGSAYIAVVEFADPVQAMVLTTYGNASQSTSPHYGDQLVLAAKKELRPALRTRAAIMANLEAHTRFE